MSINAISAAMSASVYIQQIGNKLPEWLIEKLVDAGIDPNDVSSISEGKKLLEETPQAPKSDSKDGAQNGESKDLREKAIDLADKLGIKVDDNDKLEDIIQYIQEVIDMVMKAAIAKNDESLFNEMQNYQSDLDGIVAEHNGGGVSNSVVYSFMDMVAEQNKYALGINRKE